ncbi:hypothetical protein [Paraburkholderia kirstenboschensis]|uniref:Uncharacterized protein n=1 Tax=Paraburkholderia kirstenboschensis TaxID=1245436 RepID=A0ABZ0ET71_9BURK|nr:hypothetical protein [Paraburkholderia kirstenboschensis]WOD19806.1 hypothetical protein RW095_26720 [Paraburkholderia kirstenboschensis]
MSWHHGDWLSLAQAAVSAVAILGAFGVVLFQNWAQTRQAHRLAITFAKRAYQTANEFVFALEIHYDSPSLLNAIDVLIDRRTSFDRLLLLPLDVHTISQIELVRSSITKLISVCRRAESELGSEHEDPARPAKSAKMVCLEMKQAIDAMQT